MKELTYDITFKYQIISYNHIKQKYYYAFNLFEPHDDQIPMKITLEEY